MTKKRSEYGRLWEILPNGSKRLLTEPRTFAALQELKKQFINRGYDKKSLLITY